MYFCVRFLYLSFLSNIYILFQRYFNKQNVMIVLLNDNKSDTAIVSNIAKTKARHNGPLRCKRHDVTTLRRMRKIHRCTRIPENERRNFSWQQLAERQPTLL